MGGRGCGRSEGGGGGGMKGSSKNEESCYGYEYDSPWDKKYYTPHN